MNSIRLLIVAWFSCATLVSGQLVPQPKDPSAILTKIFGKNFSFSATAHVTMKNANGKEMMRMESAVAMLDGKMRNESDMTKMQGAAMPPEAVIQMKQMGMDRTVTIVLPTQKIAYLIYPSLNAYCELPIPPAQDNAQEPKVTKTELGKETVAGHPCVKYKVTVADTNGQTLESIIWQATDLKDFPIQTQITNSDGTLITVIYKDINQTPPVASLFELPAGCKKYGNVQELMMGSMQRMMGQ